jgi:arylsulfatase A-like enzyme
VNRCQSLAISAALITTMAFPATVAQALDKPNIVFVLMDNLGYGELGVYGGGILRGAPTPRIDQLAAEGTRLTNFNVESQCTPSRSAILTGRYAIRSGTHSVPFPGQVDGLTQWEVTIAELLSGQGYATAMFGKWHLGSDQDRHPTKQGFDEWFGIPRTTDEALWPTAVGFAASGIDPEHMMEGKAGEDSRELAVYDLEQRRLIDEEVTRRAIDFMTRSVKADKPFYAYVAMTQPHLPTLPNPAFAGTTGFGDFPDVLAEMDFRVGQLLDAVDELGMAENTIFVFTSDNGPDPTFPHQGSSGPWRGYYFTHMEGSSRTPFIIRWPGKVPAGRVSNEIVHEMDTFTTFARIAGAAIPSDRPIDGVDQTDFLLGEMDTSKRDGILLFNADRLEAVKWTNWKLHLYDEQYNWFTPPAKLGTPKLFNLILDPKEEFPVTVQNTWAVTPITTMIAEFAASTQKYPLIVPGTPDPYMPPQ